MWSRVAMRILSPSLAAALVLACLAAGGVSAGSQRPPGTWCGGALWRLLTLSDPGVARVNFEPVPTSIAAISKLRPPARIAGTRASKFQHHVWRLRTVVDRYRLASNGEIVLILYSIDSAQYMNAYLPNPDCLGHSSRQRRAMLAARSAFTSSCPALSPSFQLLGTTVDIAGAGFWNPVKTTRGALPNGAELRPVTSLRIVAGCGVG
jgi:hypothetical protein